MEASFPANASKADALRTRQFALSRRKQGFESPRERKRNQILTTFMSFGVQRLSNKRSWTAMDIKTHRSAFQARW